MTITDYEEFVRDQTDMRLDLFRDRRPAVFASPGRLHRDVHTWLEGMVWGENRTLYIGGPTGTGKSWSLWKSVETLLVNGWRGRWEIVTATDFADVIKPPVAEERLDRIRECEFLALDDVGAWRVSDWTAENLYSVIDYRWAHMLPVVVTSNAADLAELLGARIASRLSDNLTSVVLSGPDRRIA